MLPWPRRISPLTCSRFTAASLSSPPIAFRASASSEAPLAVSSVCADPMEPSTSAASTPKNTLST